MELIGTLKGWSKIISIIDPIVLADSLITVSHRVVTLAKGAEMFVLTISFLTWIPCRF